MRRWLQERRDRLRELAVADLKNRCTFCKRELMNDSYVIRFTDPEQRFCTRACLADQEERDEVLR